MKISTHHEKRDGIEYFEITQRHLDLIRNVNISWVGGVYGVLCIDEKRPYGNGDMVRDLARLLPGVTSRKQALELHRETEMALRICLKRQKFETGKFAQSDAFSDWAEAIDAT